MIKKTDYTPQLQEANRQPQQGGNGSEATTYAPSAIGRYGRVIRGLNGETYWKPSPTGF